jgi:hypothetical protein
MIVVHDQLFQGLGTLLRVPSGRRAFIRVSSRRAAMSNFVKKGSEGVYNVREDGLYGMDREVSSLPTRRQRQTHANR